MIDDLQGHWRRDWIKSPGFADHATRVHWMQAGDLFADLRVPPLRPDILGATCLADLSQAALARLLRAEGFAGHITVAGRHCTWHREINWHGVPQAKDIGLMSFEDGALIEDGVHADYRELWQRRPATDLRGYRIRAGDMSGILITGDTDFLIALGPVPNGTTDDLRADLDCGAATAAALRHHFASVYCLGDWHGDAGIAQLSTNPFSESQVVLHRGDGFRWHAMTFDGHPLDIGLQIVG